MSRVPEGLLSAQPCRSREFRPRSPHHPICRPSSSRICQRWFVELRPLPWQAARRWPGLRQGSRSAWPDAGFVRKQEKVRSTTQRRGRTTKPFLSSLADKPDGAPPSTSLFAITASPVIANHANGATTHTFWSGSKKSATRRRHHQHGGNENAPKSGASQSCPHRPLGVVLMRSRVAEIDQNPIAHVLGDK